MDATSGMGPVSGRNGPELTGRQLPTTGDASMKTCAPAPGAAPRHRAAPTGHPVSRGRHAGMRRVVVVTVVMAGIIGVHDFAHAAPPSTPFLFPFVDGQTRIRLQWSGYHDVRPTIEDHKIEVCAELDADDCSDDDGDWRVLEAAHPQATPYASNKYTHEDLAPGSTRHYRVTSRNADGNATSRVRSATTKSMVPVPAECAVAFWSAEITVGRQEVFDKRGYISTSLGAISDSSFMRRETGDTEYTVSLVYFGQTSSFEEERYGWKPDYHFAITTALPEARLGDFVLYVGDVTLPFGEVTTHSTQTYGEAYRWASMDYKDTFEYVSGDKVPVCLTDAAPPVTLVLTPDSIDENQGTTTVTATVEEGSSDPFTVTVSAAAVDPAVTADFQISSNKILTFAASATESTGTVTITAADNNVYEPGKTVEVSGELSAGARPTPPSPVTLMIDEDDDIPELSLSVDPNEISEATGTSTITVSTGDSTFSEDQTITLVIASESTATETDDYTVSSKSLTLGAGQTEVTATIEAKEDSVYEGDETIVVSASHDGNTVGSAQTITIEENESEPELSISDAQASEGDEMRFVVELSGAVSSDVVVSYATTHVSAVAGTDYTGVSATTLTFTGGETSKTVTVATTEDDLNEAAETFTVELTEVSFPAGVS
ncbi:MAG: hypothetical protein OXC31_26735, partial [Spirochaetaceae bacterium]|nr:hypothetical protein [Spirochaetaceae bacterium]